MMVGRKPRLIPLALWSLLLVGSSLGLAHSPRVATAQAGLRIAFESDRDGNNEIYTLFNDGTNQERLTNNSSFDGEPRWSPDSSRITFVSSR